MRPIPSPHKRTRLIKNGATIAKGRQMALEAQAWMEGARDEFMAVHGFLAGLRDAGRKGRVRDRAAIFCLDNGISFAGGKRGLTNANWAAMERYLALYDPSLVGTVIEMGDSYIDCYGLLPVSWLPEIGERHDR